MGGPLSATNLNHEEYIPIQSLDIEAESRINFDLYVNLPLNNRYIRYRRKGGSLEGIRLEKFAEGNVSNFYILKKDYQEFVKYVARRIHNLLGGDPHQENVKVSQATAKAILASTLEQSDPVIAATMLKNLNDITGVVIENSLSQLDTKKNLPIKIFHKLYQLAEKGTDFQKHPINVTSLAVLITFGIGYTRQNILADVAMAGLLHDIGLSKLPTKIIHHSHRPLSLSIEERTQLYKHPEMTLKILEEKRIPISDLCRTLILQHHEEFNGSGYPQGLRGFNINELSQILRVAEEIEQLFVDLYENPGSLRLRVAETLRDLGDSKSIEPSLLTRIRQVLF